jgi:hypothetical protein
MNKLENMGIDVLSLAVLAFAVEDMNDRESVITSETPFAFLRRKGQNEHHAYFIMQMNKTYF